MLFVAIFRESRYVKQKYRQTVIWKWGKLESIERTEIERFRRQTHRHIAGQHNRQTDSMTDRQMGRQHNRQTNR